MKNKVRNPSAIQQPVAPYSMSVEVAAGSRLLFISGQVGAMPDGTVPKGIEAQAELAFGNLLAVLKDAGLGPENLVKTTILLTRRDDAPGFGKIRSKMFRDIVPASTLMYVAGLAHPDYLIEIDAVAAG